MDDRFCRVPALTRGMAHEHEYALLGGFNRSRLGRLLAIASSSISAFLVFLALSLFDLVRSWGLDPRIPPMVTSLFGAGMVFAVLYFLFDRVLWKLPGIRLVLKLPNLAGTWKVEGVSEDKSPPSPWVGVITITQSWDRLRVHLETSESTSDSVSAALVHDGTAGHRLLYHYRNEPKFGQPDLAAHHGFGDLTFSCDGRTASGGYFNGRGRNTYGSMRLTKEAR